MKSSLIHLQVELNEWGRRYGTQIAKRLTLLFAALICMMTSETTLRATQILQNSGFESGFASWTIFSGANFNTSIQNTPTHGGTNSFKVFGAFSGSANWQGVFQKLPSAPGSVYQADGYIQSLGTDWIGVGNNQNYAWLEVSFLDSNSRILTQFRSTNFDSTSASNTWVECPVTIQYNPTNSTIIGTNLTGSLTAPVGTVAVQFNVDFEQANGGGGSVFVDDLSLNQVAGPVPPVIANLTPDGSSLFNFASTNLTFAVTSATTTINPSGIHVTANGVDVSSLLVIGGTSQSRTVSLALFSNLVYAVSITVTDAVGFTASASAYFATFSANSYIWEAEDYDYNAAHFIDNPQTNAYFALAGTSGIDFNEIGNNGNHLYRTNDTTGTDILNGGLLRAKYSGTGFTNYYLGWFDSGEWVNYTRTLPAGKYNIYARAAGGAGVAQVDLSIVTGGVGTSSQTTALLGSFQFVGLDWFTYNWVPLVDTNANLVAVTLGGKSTLRVTSHGGANLDFFILVPAKLDLPMISGIYPDGTRLLQNTNKFLFTAASVSATIPNSGITVSLNGTDVSSQLVIAGASTNKSVTYPGLKSNQLYTAVISVIDANGSFAFRTVSFDTYNPSFLWEGEDWDYNNGQFINSPIPTSTVNAQSYFNRTGVQGVDENETGVVNTNWSNTATVGDGPGSDHAFRTNDPEATILAGDIPRQAFLNTIPNGDTNATDYALGWFEAGEWVNYTRTLPAGTYNVYARMANGNGGNANAYLDLVTNGLATASQFTTRLGTFTFQAQGWAAYEYVPLRDQFGNLAAVSLGGTQTLRLTSGPLGGGVNVNFLMLLPARTDLPTITGVWPEGSTLLQGTNAFTFTAANPNVPITNIQVVLNGFDVSSQLSFSGTPPNIYNARLPVTFNYTNYVATINVTDASNNVATTTVYFDTFSPTNFTWEAEDFDFNGGSYIDNPAINAYANMVSVPGVDENYVTYDGPLIASYLYRPFDYIASYVCSDTPLPSFVAAAYSNLTLTNYGVGWWHTNAWINYTHTYPSGTYFIYGRLAGGNGLYNIMLDQVTGNATNHLGTFTATGRGFSLYDWVPVVNNGQLARVTLGGVTTLRATTDGNANANLYMLVPATATPASMSLAASRSLSGGGVVISFATLSGYNYLVYYKNNLTDVSWTLLTIVAGDGTVKGVHDASGGAKRFYRVGIQ